MGQKFLFVPGNERLEALREAAERAGLPMSELLRRLLDHGLRPPVLNDLVPRMSGGWSTVH